MGKNSRPVKMKLIQEPLKKQREHISLESIEELSGSMRKLGLLQPILIRKNDSGYEIEAGHRRFLAAQMLGWEEIEAKVLDSTDEDSLHLERAHENLIREDLNPVEEAEVVWDLVYEDGRGVEKTAALLCKKVGWVERRLDIHLYPDDLKEAVRKNLIKLAVANELKHVKDQAARERLLNSVIEFGASSRTVKHWIEDSQVGQFIENRETKLDQDDNPVIARSEVSMVCRICNLTHNIDVLRHIWICPECLGVIRELARETQKQLAAVEE